MFPTAAPANRPMPRLWRHVLLDSVRHGWPQLVASLVHVVGFMALFLVEEQAAGTNVILRAAPFILLWGALFAYQQYVAYPLLAALPVSRATRGRIAWTQHVLAMPALYLLCVAPLALVQAALGPSRLFTPFQFALMAYTAVPPAVALLIWRRLPFNAGYLPVVIYVAAGFLGWSLYKKVNAGDPFAVSAWPLLAAACALIVALSYLRAPRLLVGVRLRKTTWRNPLWEKAGLPPLMFGRIAPLWHMALVEPLRYAPPVIVVLILLGVWGDRQGIMLSMLAGAVTLAAWIRAATLAIERARLMRMLPVTTTRIAEAVMIAGAAGGLYTAAAAVVMATAPEPAPGALACAVLIGTCGGAFIPTHFVRFTHNIQRASLTMVIAMIAMVILLNPVILDVERPLWLLPLLIITAPACLFFATLTLREVFLYDTAYQYRKPPLQAMSEG